ncbi:hypothetical protein PFISCL1PPCAC_3240, partial [Pristionchus fissidentatus]
TSLRCSGYPWLDAPQHPHSNIAMQSSAVIVLIVLSVALLERAHASPISNRDLELREQFLEDLMEKVNEEVQIRQIEREILQQEAEEIPQISSAPTKRDSNEKRNLSRLATMGARGFGRRR